MKRRVEEFATRFPYEVDNEKIARPNYSEDAGASLIM